MGRPISARSAASAVASACVSSDITSPMSFPSQRRADLPGPIPLPFRIAQDARAIRPVLDETPDRSRVRRSVSIEVMSICLHLVRLLTREEDLRHDQLLCLRLGAAICAGPGARPACPLGARGGWPAHLVGHFSAADILMTTVLKDPAPHGPAGGAAEPGCLPGAVRG